MVWAWLKLKFSAHTTIDLFQQNAPIESIIQFQQLNIIACRYLNFIQTDNKNIYFWFNKN